MKDPPRYDDPFTGFVLVQSGNTVRLLTISGSLGALLDAGATVTNPDRSER